VKVAVSSAFTVRVFNDLLYLGSLDYTYTAPVFTVQLLAVTKAMVGEEIIDQQHCRLHQ